MQEVLLNESHLVLGVFWLYKINMKPLILFLQQVFCNWTKLILYFQKVHVKGVNTYWRILQNLPILEPRQPVARGKKTYYNWPLNTYTNIDLPVGIWNTAKYLSMCSYYAGFSKTSAEIQFSRPMPVLPEDLHM